MAETALTRQQVADRLGVSLRHVQNLEARFSIPVLRAGRVIRYDDLAYQALLEALRSPAKPPLPPVRRSCGSPAFPFSLDGGYARALAALAEAKAPIAVKKPRR